MSSSFPSIRSDGLDRAAPQNSSLGLPMSFRARHGPTPDEPVRACEVGAEAPRGRGAVLAGERTLSRGGEELPVNADEQRGGNAGVDLVQSLFLERPRDRLAQAGHHLALLRAQVRRLLDQPG